LLRPPLAQGRLVERNDGRYAFQMKTPWPDGTSVLVERSRSAAGDEHLGSVRDL
jgi:hypothetical protein